MTPISEILDKLDSTTQQYAFNGYAALVHSLQIPITLAITAYIAFIGWSVLQGWSQVTVGQITKHVLKIAIAYSLAMQWSVFSAFIYNVFTNGPDELSTILMQSAGSTTAGANALLQSAFNDGIHIGEQLWGSGGGIIAGLAMKMAAVIVWLLNFLVIGIALLEIAVAKCGLAVTLVLAPVFVLMLLWGSTKGIFDKWFSTALGFALVPLFLSAALLLVDQMMQIGLNDMSKSITDPKVKESIEMIVTFVLGCIVSIGLLLKVTSIAANIASGFSVSALGTAGATGRAAAAVAMGMSRTASRSMGLQMGTSKVIDKINKR